MEMDWVDGLKLPDGIHATILGGRDVVTGEVLAYPVVWADRPYDTCPRCHQGIGAVADCPVLLDSGACQGGQIQSVSQQHGCGEWLSVDWRDLAADASEEDVLAVAAELFAARQEAIAEGRRKIETGLRRDLAAALARLAEPLDDGETAEDRADEVTTGSEVEPGVCRDGGAWLAWAYGPVDDGDPISVYAEV